MTWTFTKNSMGKNSMGNQNQIIDKYGVMIDAGSSGSRLIVYKWKEDVSLHSLPSITSIDEHKQEPGLSVFEHDTSGLNTYFKSMLDYAAQVVPKESQSETFVYVFATAGLRLLSSAPQTKILYESCMYVQKHYLFQIQDCSNQFKVISGESEGIYGWITLNYLKNTLIENNGTNTIGFMDMV